jgi:hypothetical protein
MTNDTTARLPRNQKLAVTAALLLEAIILLPPVLSLLPSGQRVGGGPIVTILQIIIIPVALLQWLEAGTAKLLCIPLGVAICAVILCPSVRPRTKRLVTVLGVVPYISAVRWAGTVRFG